MRKCAGLEEYFCILCGIIRLYEITAFCNGDRSGIKVTFPTAKTAHVSWDVSHSICSPPITGYVLHYNFDYNHNVIYKDQTVSGERTGNVDVPVFPSFRYSMYVNPTSSSGELTTLRPDTANFTVKKTVPSASPSRLTLLKKTDTTITIRWDKLGPFQRNGNIFGYMIYYKSATERNSHSMKISGENNLTATLSSLTPASTYKIFICAVGEVGNGPYNNPPFTVRTNPHLTSSTTAVNKHYTSTIKSPTSTLKPNPGTLNSVIPATSNVIIYTTVTASSSRRLQTSFAVTTSNIHWSSYNTHVSTTTEEPEADNRWDRILIIVGIAFGILLLIAICVPLILHFCRCCGKGSVSSSTSTKEEEKSQADDNNEFKDLKDESNRPFPVSRSTRHVPNLSRKLSYKWKSDHEREINADKNYDDFRQPLYTSDKRNNLYNEIDVDSISDREMREHDYKLQHSLEKNKPEFRFWPEFQHTLNKSRLIDSWRIGNDFPNSELTTDGNTYFLRNSGHPKISNENLQYRRKRFVDDSPVLVDNRNNNIELETRVGKTNGEIMQAKSTQMDNHFTEIDKDFSYLPRIDDKLYMTNADDTETLSITSKALQNSLNEQKRDLSRKAKIVPEAFDLPENKGSSTENFKNGFDKQRNNHMGNIISKKLEKTNNVYIHNYMSFKGIFSRNRNPAQVSPEESTVYDDVSNFDEKGLSTREGNNIAYSTKDSKSNLRAILYEPV